MNENIFHCVKNLSIQNKLIVCPAIRHEPQSFVCPSALFSSNVNDKLVQLHAPHFLTRASSYHIVKKFVTIKSKEGVKLKIPYLWAKSIIPLKLTCLCLVQEVLGW